MEKSQESSTVLPLTSKMEKPQESTTCNTLPDQPVDDPFRNLEGSQESFTCSDLDLESTTLRSSLKVHRDCRSKKVRFRTPGTVRRLPKTETPLKMARIKKRYFTAGCLINDSNQRNLLSEQSPFAYPSELKEFAHDVLTKEWRSQQRRKEMAYKYWERHNQMSRQKADMLNRLYVKKPDISGLKTITDIDPEYYSTVEGRPIKEKLKLRDYIGTIRDVLKTKILTGYRGDDIMLIDESLILEQKQIDLIREDYQMYAAAFEECLYIDHTSSMNLLKEADREALHSQEKYEEFKQLSKEYSSLKAIVYATEEKWRTCKLYQRFLYLVSPMHWRQEHDFYFMQEDHGGMEKVSTIFEKYRHDVTEETASLADLIGEFRADCARQMEPQLYFTDPEELLEVFKFMELQNLNSLLHSEELAGPLETVQEGMAKAEQLFTSEINTLQELIDKLAGGIAWEEERAEYLEALALELIDGEFKNLVVAEEVLNLHVFVEDAYETRIGPNDANLSICEMMKMIEIKFREELVALDQMPSEQVQQLEVGCYKEEARRMKAAQYASRQLAEFELLFQKMKKVFSPPYQKRAEDHLVWRSPPPKPPKIIPPPPRSLTAEELQFLEFFTDYCEHTDDLKDYGIDISAEPSENVDSKSGRSGRSALSKSKSDSGK